MCYPQLACFLCCVWARADVAAPVPVAAWLRPVQPLKVSESAPVVCRDRAWLPCAVCVTTCPIGRIWRGLMRVTLTKWLSLGSP